MKQYLTLLILSATFLSAQDAIIEKVVHFKQTDASTTTLASSNPYGLLAEVIDVPGYAGGTLSWNNGSAQSLTFVEDSEFAGEWLASADFANESALDTFAPDAITYSFSNNGGTVAGLTFDPSISTEVYPEAPLLVMTGGVWDTGTYVLNQGATLGWSTTLDVNPGAGEIGWYMFGDFFGPGAGYFVDENSFDGGDGVLTGSYAGLGAGDYTLEFNHGYAYDSESPTDGELDGVTVFAGLVSSSSITVQIIPEPSQAAILFGLSAFGFVMLRRRAR